MKTVNFLVLVSVLATSPLAFGQLNITDITGATGVFRLLTFNDTDIQISPVDQASHLNVDGLGSNGILEGSFPNADFRLSSFNQGTAINLTNSILDVKSIVITSSSAGNNIGLDTSISNTLLRSSTDILIQGDAITFGENSIFDTDSLTVEATSLIVGDPMNFFGLGQAVPTASINGSSGSLVYEPAIDFTKSITYTAVTGQLNFTFDRVGNVIDENFGFVDVVVSQTATAVPEPSVYALLLGAILIFFTAVRKSYYRNHKNRNQPAII